MKRPTLESTKGSFKSFVNRYPPLNGLTAKKLLEDFIEKRPKYEVPAKIYYRELLEIAYQIIRKKEKYLERIFNE